MFHQVFIPDTGQEDDARPGTSHEEDPMKHEPDEATLMETDSVEATSEIDEECKSRIEMAEQGIIENLVAEVDTKVKRKKLTLKELKKPLKLNTAKILRFRKNRMSTFQRLLKQNLKTPTVRKEKYVFVFVLNDEVYKLNSPPLSSSCNDIIDISSSMTSFSAPERLKLDSMNLPVERIQNVASRVIDDLSKRNKRRNKDAGHKYYVVSNRKIPDKNEDKCLTGRTRASIFRSAKAKSNNASVIEYDDDLLADIGLIEDDLPTPKVKAKKPRKIDQSQVEPNKEDDFKCIVCTKNFKSETMLRRHKESASCKKRTSIFLGTSEIPTSTQAKEPVANKVEEESIKKEEEVEVANESDHSDYRFSDDEADDIGSDSDFEATPKKLRIRKNTTKYSCKKCLLDFAYKTLLNKHVRTVCGARPKDTFVCEVCGKHFGNRQVFKRHVRDHKETEQNLRQYECGECAKRFNRRASLYMHVKKVHRKKVLSYVCAHCGLKSVSKEHIIAHERIHQLPEGAELPAPFQCHCGKAFISNHLLTEHRRQKHRPKRCIPCSQDFHSIPDLIRHKQQVHGKEVSQRCPVCARQLANVLSLNVHLENTHNIKNSGKEKDIRCRECAKMFVTFGSFVNHMWEFHEHRVTATEIQAVNKQLTDDLSYFYNAKKMCPICHKELASALSLNNHIESIHKLRTCSATKSIRCDLCGKSFAMLGSYINHKGEVHKEEVQAAEIESINDRLVRESPAPPSRSQVTCPSCGKLFKNRTSLYMHEYNVHRPSKSVVCTVCRLSFDGRKSYLDHKYDVHTPVEQKVCRLCNKQFRSRGAHWAHKYVHSTPTHKCTACGSVFKRKGDFTRHIKDKHSASANPPPPALPLHHPLPHPHPPPPHHPMSLLPIGMPM